MSDTAHHSTSPANPLAGFTPERLADLAHDLDQIRDRVMAELGERDRRHIEGVIAVHRWLEVTGRGAMLGAAVTPSLAIGFLALSAAKILENMEIGHNVLHGQWDWMNDHRIHSSTWDWDTISNPESWKHSHNYVHHTFTNIRGTDKDIGYEILRIDPRQHWHPIYLLQPFYNLILMALFEWGVAVHDLDFEAILKGEKSKAQVRREVRLILEKAKTQVLKDYVAWPLVSAAVTAVVDFGVSSAMPRRRREGARGRLRRALSTGRRAGSSALKANAAANVARNIWIYATVFCGHFPDQAYTFSRREVEGESKGGWYVRQMTGSANYEGSRLFHIFSGHVGYQVEHHLFPDMPTPRYAEIAPEIEDVCERYGLPYNIGPFFKQLGMVQRTILRLSFPGGGPRPKPGPYRRPTDCSEMEAAGGPSATAGETLVKAVR
jgi:NADPH-dependent stearoyl-CoA 9-desaturase